MRDIRNDLRERLRFLDGRQGDVMASYMEARERIESERSRAIEEIESERAALKQLLAIEDRRALSLPLVPSDAAPSVPLADFLITKARAADRILREELRAAAEEAGYDGGRAFHTTLMNITKGGRLRQLPDGSYITPDKQYDFGEPDVIAEDRMQTLI